MAELQRLINMKQTEKGMKEFKWPKSVSSVVKEAVSPDGRNRILYSGGMITVCREFTIKAGDKIKVRLAPGGGYAARFVSR